MRDRIPTDHQLPSDLRRRLTRTHAGAAPPPELEDRTLAALRHEGLIGAGAPRRVERVVRGVLPGAVTRVAAAAAIFAAGVIVGWLAVPAPTEPHTVIGRNAASVVTDDSTSQSRAATNLRHVVWF